MIFLFRPKMDPIVQRRALAQGKAARAIRATERRLDRALRK
jgi:hypothetical protein